MEAGGLLVGGCLMPCRSLLSGMETMSPFTISFGMDTTRLPKAEEGSRRLASREVFSAAT